MVKKWAGLLLCTMLGLACAWAAARQDTNGNSKHRVRNLSGCLTKTSNGNQYLLTATDGSTWEIHADSELSLADHVGQKVEVTGVVAHEQAHIRKEDAKPMGGDAGMKSKPAEHGQLRATEIDKAGGPCEQ